MSSSSGLRRRRHSLAASTSAKLEQSPHTTTAAAAAASFSSPPLSTTSSSSSRWSVALNAVWATQHLQASQQKHKDGLGTALQRRFNQHPAFRYATTNTPPRPRSTAPTFVYPPLLSRHNGRVLGHYIRHCCYEYYYGGSSTPTDEAVPTSTPTTRATLWATVVVLGCLALGVSLCGAVVTAAAGYLLVTLTTFLVTYIVDWRDWVPSSVIVQLDKWFWYLRQSLHSLDDTLLGGLQHRDREWTADGDFYTPPYRGTAAHDRRHHDKASDRTSSTTLPLWALPPPTIAQTGKRLALQATHLERPEQWSTATVQHMVALDFCYVMLREHELLKQASAAAATAAYRRRSRTLATTATATSTASGTTTTTSIVGMLPCTGEVRATADPSSSSRTPSPTNAADNSLILVSHNLDDNEIELQVSRSDEHDEDLAAAVGNNRIASDQVHEGEHWNPLLSPDDDDLDSATSDVVSELPWIDVGAKIGMRLLNSAHVHRAVASTETSEFLMASSQDLLQLEPSLGSGSATTTLTGMNHSDPRTSFTNTSSTALTTTSHTASSSSSTSASLVREQSLSTIVLPSLQVVGGSAAPGVLKRKPVHPLWTSPGAAADSLGSLSPPSSRPTSPPASPTVTSPRMLQPPHRYSNDNVSSLVETGPIQELHLPQHSAVKRSAARSPLSPGVRVAVPVTPLQPSSTTFRRYTSRSNTTASATAARKTQLSQQYQMGSVVRSERIWVLRENSNSSSSSPSSFSLTPNCLSVTVKLEKSFLRNGEFADLTFRVMDHWPDRYMPKHSKVPIGACVATTFGIGVLIGWRVEDDIHIVTSLWQRRGPGSGRAYLNRTAIHGVVEASVGFSVETPLGTGQVVAYVDGGCRYDHGRYLVNLSAENGSNHVLSMGRKDIFSCHGAQFVPVIEYIRAAANYQMQLDMYIDSLEDDEMRVLSPNPIKSETFESLSEILWTSFCKAVDEDKDFDEGVSQFMTSVIEFLERLDGKSVNEEEDVLSVMSDDFAVECVATTSTSAGHGHEPGFWFTNDILGGIFGSTEKTIHKEDTISLEYSQTVDGLHTSLTDVDAESRSRHLERTEAFIQTLLKTVSNARVACVDKVHFRLGLAIAYDILLFIRTIIKVQKKNMSVNSSKVWKRALDEIWSTFGPIQDRLRRIGEGIAQRMEQQGKKAKARVIRFVDSVLGDERLLIALEQGDWDRCVKQLEAALIHSAIIERENLIYYRKTLSFLYDHVRLTLSNQHGAARRNSEKIAILAKVIQWVAAPRRSLLKLFENDDVLDLFERILVRVFHKEELASRKVMIHALNFHSLRHLRMLKDFSTSGGLWMPVLDAADEEISWMVSHFPPNTKEILTPIANLFSLCVAQFHRIAKGDLTQDWMNFLLQDDAVRIIHDIDMKLILALESFSHDVKEMMVVLPYYSNIDVDILNLMDEVNLDEFLKEASSAMDDPEKLTEFFREKATIAVQRFLDWLPRISIPVEKRELIDGWVLTCRGEDGGDLTLSDVSVKKENLVCQIMGGDALFFPMFGDDVEEEIASLSDDVMVYNPRGGVSSAVVEESVLDSIREMLLQAERFGCWTSGVGGVGQPPTDRYVASVLHGLPVSAVLNCAIEMWRNLEIDDDELLEIAVKDVSYQIQLQTVREEGADEGGDCDATRPTDFVHPSYSGASVEVRIADSTSSSSSTDGGKSRFNPRADPTVLLLDMKNLTLRLDNFMFRIEKDKNQTLLDPVFEGIGSLTIQNASIKVRVECGKERIRRTAMGENFAPVLVLKELVTTLEHVKLRVRDTAFGSDWLVNKAVHAFSDDITKAVEENLREQVEQQAKTALENLNAYFLLNPNMLLNLLGISLEDLDDHVIWV